MGVSSGSASGWPAADWICRDLPQPNGPDMYDKWVAHQIPWTDSSIKNAFQMFGADRRRQELHQRRAAVDSRHRITGRRAISPSSRPPTAYMYYLGDFTEGFITAQFKSAKAGTDFNFFPFPTINRQYARARSPAALTSSSRCTNNSAVQALVQVHGDRRCAEHLGQARRLHRGQ